PVSRRSSGASGWPGGGLQAGRSQSRPPSVGGVDPGDLAVVQRRGSGRSTSDQAGRSAGHQARPVEPPDELLRAGRSGSDLPDGDQLYRQMGGDERAARGKAGGGTQP